jgi:hypothetical protein
VKEPSKLEKALAAYTDNPVLQAVVQIIPHVGTWLDADLQQRHATMRAERIADVFEELARQSTTVAPEMLEDVDFCRAVIITLNAAGRASTTAKAHLFARMLSNYERIVTGSTIEQYEELLRILDDMSVREYQLLLLVREANNDPTLSKQFLPTPPGARNLLTEVPAYWIHFLNIAHRQGFASEEIPSLLTRLTRTGFYQPKFADWGADGQYGNTTPYFERFLLAVEQHEREHAVPTRQ